MGAGVSVRDSAFRPLDVSDMPPSAKACSVEEIAVHARPGSQVFVRCAAPSRGLPIVEFLHHGIYLGSTHDNGGSEPVVAELRRDGKIRAIPLPEFAGGRVLYVDTAERPNAGGLAEARRALALGKCSYNLMTSNCEHLASLCSSGTFRSRQVSPSTLAEGFCVPCLTLIEASLCLRAGGHLPQAGRSVLNTVAHR